MSDSEKRYTGERIVVRYNAKRCIHFAACVRGLPGVFDPQRRPWIAPDNADADALAAVVLQCPTGALHFERLDEGAAEQPEPEAKVAVAADGPLYLRGDVTVQRDDGTPVITDTRVALCRCGLSGNKPFCDGSHHGVFHDDGTLAPQTAAPVAPQTGPITVTVSERGPYRVAGVAALSSADGSETRTCDGASLCRCGASKHKPFCDGTHRTIDQEIFK